MPSVDMLSNFAIFSGVDSWVSRSASRFVLLRREASSRISRGEAPCAYLSKVLINRLRETRREEKLKDKYGDFTSSSAIAKGEG